MWASNGRVAPHKRTGIAAYDPDSASGNIGARTESEKNVLFLIARDARLDQSEAAAVIVGDSGPLIRCASDGCLMYQGNV
jgi:hypothetical protein